VLGRYSLSYLPALGVMAGMIAISGISYLLSRTGIFPEIRLHLPSTPAFGYLTIGGSLAGLFLVWILLRPSGAHLPAIAVFRLYIVALMVAVVLLLLRVSRLFDLPVPDRWIPRIPILLAAITVGLTLLYLGRAPRSLPYDEAYITYRAVSWFAAGEPRAPMVPYLERPFLAMTPASFLGLGVWLDAVGVSLEMGRLFFLIVGWLGVPFIYVTARRLYGRTAGLFAVAFASIVMLEHNYIRPDFLIPTAVSIALCCFMRARDTNKQWLHFIAGFVLALSVEGHPYGVRFAISFGLIYAIDHARAVWKARRWQWNAPLLLFAAGGLAYLIIYLVVHVVIWGQIDLGAAFSTLETWYRMEANLGGAVGRRPLLEKAITLGGEWLTRYPGAHPVEAALALFGIVAAARRWLSPDTLLLTTFLPSLAIFFLMMAHDNPYYWIHNLPFIAILGGAFLAEICGTLAQNAKLNIASAAGLGALVVLLVSNLFVVSRYGQTSADRLIEIGKEINQVLPSEVRRVSGWQIYYFGLFEREFYDILSLGRKPASDWMPDWGIEPPQALIITQGLDDTMSNAQQYIESGSVVAVRCFESDLYGGLTILYVERGFASDSAPVNCDAQ
jgi:hypothetical protein